MSNFRGFYLLFIWLKKMQPLVEIRKFHMVGCKGSCPENPTSVHAKNLRIGGKPKGEGLDHVGQLKAGERFVARVVCGFFLEGCEVAIRRKTDMKVCWAKVSLLFFFGKFHVKC